MTAIPASAIALHVPPVETRATPRCASARAKVDQAGFVGNGKQRTLDGANVGHGLTLQWLRRGAESRPESGAVGRTTGRGGGSRLLLRAALSMFRRERKRLTRR